MQASGRFNHVSFGQKTYVPQQQMAFGGLSQGVYNGVKHIGEMAAHHRMPVGPRFADGAPNNAQAGFNLNRPAPTMFTGKKLDITG